MTYTRGQKGLFMAYYFNYYYINNLDLAFDELHTQQPVLLSVSKVQNGPKGETKTHMHAHLEIFYFAENSGYFEFNDKTFPIKANDLLIINARQMHRQYSENEKPLVYYCFAVDNIQLKNKKRNCITDSNFFLYSFPDSDNVVFHSISRLLKELKEKNYGYAVKVEAIFMELLIEMIRLFTTKNNFSDTTDPHILNKKVLNETKKYIDDHFQENLTLEDLAAVSFMNKSYFSHQFKKLFGISPFQYLSIVRLEQAKLLLTSTDNSITQISSDVGYDNPAYFAEQFKKFIKISPSGYRKQIYERSKKK